MGFWLQAMQLMKDTYIRDNTAQDYKFIQHYPLDTLGGDGGTKRKKGMYEWIESGENGIRRIEKEQREREKESDEQ